MGSLATICTDTVPVSNCVEYWQENAATLLGRLHIEQAPGQPFRGSFAHSGVADLVLCKINSTPHSVSRTTTFARQYDRGYLKAVLQMKGTSLLDQDGRTTTIEPGFWSLYDTARPYRLTLLDQNELLLVLVPRERIFTAPNNLRNLTVRKFSGCSGVGKLACQLVNNTFDEIALLNLSTSFDVADSITQLLRLALLTGLPEQLLPPSRELLRERIKSLVAAHLRSPNLSVDGLASLTRCSKRYLHKVFEHEQLSISEYILRLRLERCRQSLLDPSCLNQSITDIAFSWGFNNSNHFSRSFKQAFGVSPRSLRAEVPNESKTARALQSVTRCSLLN
jgi:AraC-like DNA-binding protein